MAITLDINFFNSFYLKRIYGSTTTGYRLVAGFTLSGFSFVGAGGFTNGTDQAIVPSGGTYTGAATFTMRVSGTNPTNVKVVLSGKDLSATVLTGETIIFDEATIEAVFGGGGAGDVTVTIGDVASGDEELMEPGRIPYPPVENAAIYNWAAPMIADVDYDWYIEESRIRGGYNNTSVDFGVKAYLVSEEDVQQRRGNTLIYSGIFNSRTGINDTNQFSVAESITRSVDPVNGTIQKLFAEDTNLTIFQERKVNVALIDKDAIYTAEGVGLSSTGRVVIGQITPVPGNWGIGTNPESFATYGYIKYFVDKERNAVLKLQGSQIQEISNAGMMDFFRDQLSLIGDGGYILGGYDVYNQNYVISLQQEAAVFEENSEVSSANYKTLTFDERNQGWTSFYTYSPDDMFSCKGNYYSFKGNAGVSYLYKHYDSSVANNRNTFYGIQSDSTIQFVFNPTPSNVKTFKTINYEGSNGWEVTNLISDSTGQDATVTPPGGWLSNYDTILGGAPIVPASLLSSITTNTADGTNAVYTAAAWTTSGSGTGLVIDVTVAGQIVTVVTVTTAGDGFKAGDTITLPITTIGGTVDVIITLTATDVNEYLRIYSYDEGAYTTDGIQYRAGFDRKQNKYWAVVPNNTITPMAGEVIWGNQTMGIKGYFATVTMSTDETTNKGGLKSLFAVSGEFMPR